MKTFWTQKDIEIWETLRREILNLMKENHIKSIEITEKDGSKNAEEKVYPQHMA